jgi:hypothetical protein
MYCCVQCSVFKQMWAIQLKCWLRCLLNKGEALLYSSKAAERRSNAHGWRITTFYFICKMKLKNEYVGAFKRDSSSEYIIAFWRMHIEIQDAWGTMIPLDYIRIQSE